MTVRYWPRFPRFPVIVFTGAEIFGARNAAECSKYLANVKVNEEQTSIPVIDASAEGFAYYPDTKVVSALAVKKKWTKGEIIGLYNAHRATGTPEFSARSLGNKSVERIVSEIVTVLHAKP